MTGLQRKLRKIRATATGPYRSCESRKPLRTQVAELVAVTRKFRFFPYHYLTLGLYDRRVRGPVESYLPTGQILGRRRTLSGDEGWRVLEDKALFDRWAAGHDVPTPKTIIRTEGGRFFGPGGEVAVADATEALLNWPEDVVAKPTFGRKGMGVGRLEKTRNALRFYLKDATPYLFQERLKTHPDMLGLRANSINSIRIDTTKIDGALHHSGAFMRVGTGDNVVDILAHGGVGVAIDLETGRMAEEGVCKLSLSHDRPRAHPNTGARFGDFTVPDFALVKELVKRAARLLPDVPTIGWDVAVTADGPVIIEGNPEWDIKGMQRVCGGLRDRAIGRLLYEDYERSRGEADAKSGRPA